MASNKRLLVVDDDQTHNLICENMLLDSGKFSQVTCFLDIESAINYLHQQSSGEAPDYIFLDLSFPEHSGWCFLEQFKKEFAHKFPHMRIFIITASVSKGDWNKAKQEPLVMGFVSKPFTYEKIPAVFG